MLSLRRRPVAWEPAEKHDTLEKPFVAAKPGLRVRPTIRELRSTLVAAVYDALLPLPLVSTPEYSSYLTQQVSGLTLGWQTFRVAVELSYLLKHGFGFDTVVVQVFLACSATSLVLHMLRRQLWLRKREEICIGMNCLYGILTFLKVFSLVPRLPDETHYLFKHCLLSMADAFFCQVPVHKFYVAQFLDASVRCIVWRRYDVLPGVATPLVVLVSLAWQAWILLFSAMLQARHVTSYLRRLPPQLTVAATAPGVSGAGSKPVFKTSAMVLSLGWAGVRAATMAPRAVVEQAEGGSGGGGPGLSGTQRLLLSRMSAVSDGALSSVASALRQLPESLKPLTSTSVLASSELAAGEAFSTSLNCAGEPHGPSDLALLSRSSSSSSRTRSGLSSSARLVYRVVPVHGGDQDPATGVLEALDCGAGAGVGASKSAGSNAPAGKRGGGGSYGSGSDVPAGGSSGGGSGSGSGSSPRKGSDMAEEELRHAPIPMLSSVQSHVECSRQPARPPPLDFLPLESPLHTPEFAEPMQGLGLGPSPALPPPPPAPSSGSRSDTSSAVAAILSGAADPPGIPRPRRRASATSLLSAAAAAVAVSHFDASFLARAPGGAAAAGGHGGGGGGTAAGSRRSRQADYALRCLVRGPSSYVLLSKQRKIDQNRGSSSTSLQVCVTSANPDQLVAHWRDRLAAAVVDGAPGWHLVNSSVRKGSLIVHLDLVYAPPQHQLQPQPEWQPHVQPTQSSQTMQPAAAATVATAQVRASTPTTPPNPGGEEPGALLTPVSEIPSRAFIATIPAGSYDNDLAALVLQPTADAPTEVLERFLQGLGPSGLLHAMCLPEQPPAGDDDYISVQHGKRILRYKALTQGPTSRLPAPRVPTAGIAAAASVVAERPALPPDDEFSGGEEAEEIGSMNAVAESVAEPGAVAHGLRRRRRQRLEDSGDGAGDVRSTTLRSLRRRAARRGAFDGWASGLRGELDNRLMASNTAMLPAAVSTFFAKAALFAAALYDAVHLAVLPPPLVHTHDYVAFLHARVGPLHVAYAYLMAVATAIFYSYRFGFGLRIFNIVGFMAPELLSVGAHAAAVAGGGASADRGWVGVRTPLVHAGTALRGLLVVATCLGLVPRVKKDDDCVAMRWIMKMLLISALHVLCMQTPVRTAFLVRLLPLVGGILSHIWMCFPGEPALPAVLLHVSWEAALFVVGSLLQARHIAAFRRFVSVASGGRSPSLAHSLSTSCMSSMDDTCPSPKFLTSSVAAASIASTTAASAAPIATTTAAAAAAAGGGSKSEPLSSVPAAVAYGSGCASISTSVSFYSAAASRDKAADMTAATAAAAAAATADGQLSAAGASAAGGAAADATSEALAKLVWAAVGRWTQAGGIGGNLGADGERGSVIHSNADPWDISLDGFVLAMQPRRSHSLRLGFTCTAGVVEELQIILRHLSPASMATGTHTAIASSKIVRTLAAPAAAHLAAPPSSPLRFDAELTVVAAPFDIPGVVHVELWRGHKRLAGRPVLLAPAEVAGAGSDGAAAGGLDGGAGGEGRVSSLPGWLSDVSEYVAVLKAEGHSYAADQYLEELGTWLAQLAALERGLLGGASGGGGGAGRGADSGGPQVARVLWVHHSSVRGGLAVGSAVMARQQVLERTDRKGNRTSGGGGAAASGADAAAVVGFRQVLRCQGQGLLAVAVEAGCLALSERLMGILVGQLGAAVLVVVEGSVTPVTGLPLLHAAVKSGNPTMVDLVVKWHVQCGLIKVWAREAVVRACSLEVVPLHVPPPPIPPSAVATAPRVVSEALARPLWSTVEIAAAAGGVTSTEVADHSALMILGGDGDGGLVDMSAGDVVVEGPEVAAATAAAAAAAEAAQAERELQEALAEVLSSRVSGAGDGGRILGLYGDDGVDGAVGREPVAPTLALTRGLFADLNLDHETTSLTGSFHLETARLSLAPSNPNLPNLLMTTMAGVVSVPPPTAPLPAFPPASPSQSPAAAEAVAVAQPQFAHPPTLQPPRPLATAGPIAIKGGVGGNGGSGGRPSRAATAAAIATSYTSTGVSVAAATAAAKLTAALCTDVAVELSAPFRVVSLKPNKDNPAPSAVQELPRYTKDAAEPGGAAGCGLLPVAIGEPRLVGTLVGASEAATSSPCGAYSTAPSFGRSSQWTAAAATLPSGRNEAAGMGAAPPSASAAGASAQRSSFDGPYGGLIDGGLLLMTPLHVALALGDEGRTASHIFSTYPEAYELWHTNQLQWMAATGASNIQSAADSSTMASPFVTPSFYPHGHSHSHNVATGGATASHTSGFAAAGNPHPFPHPPHASASTWQHVLVPSGIGIRRGSSATFGMSTAGGGSSIFSLGATAMNQRASEAAADYPGGHSAYHPTAAP